MLVSKNELNLKSINDNHRLIFLPNTYCSEIRTEKILRCHFVFISFRDILASNDEDPIIVEFFVFLKPQQVFLISSIFLYFIFYFICNW